MIDKNKLLGASLVALAIALTGSVAFADRGDRMGDRMGMGGPMAAFDFAAVDADKDGKITQAEIDAYRSAQTKALDVDGDGLMSAEELVAMQMKGLQARVEQRVKAMLERMDDDKDGKLSAAEMARRPMPAMMFDRLDTDNDGALSEAEIAAAKERMADVMKERGERGDRGGMRGHGRN
ncbi:MAG: EF-hand domain-containing protein [Rhodobacteraceae bacterium]|nr:EF-hand domain-containing protein [Paracoccaceae bacterium]